MYFSYCYFILRILLHRCHDSPGAHGDQPDTDEDKPGTHGDQQSHQTDEFVSNGTHRLAKSSN